MFPYAKANLLLLSASAAMRGTRTPVTSLGCANVARPTQTGVSLLLPLLLLLAPLLFSLHVVLLLIV